MPGSDDDRLFFRPPAEREARALRLVQERAGITVAEFAEALSVSPARARKIVAKLGNRVTIDPVAVSHDPKVEASVNAWYYEQRPWDHFDRRLVALAASFGQAEGWHAFMASPTTIGPLEIHARAPDSAEAKQAHLGEVAIQSVMLLHHGAETLLRGIHAHAPSTADAPWPTCPAIASGRTRDFAAFKTWVQTSLVDDEAELWRYVRSTLGDDDRDDRIRVVSAYVRRLGEYFLDADAYNAAKHGLGIRGEHSQLTITVDDVEIPWASGVAITWLDDRGPKPRMTTHWYSIEGLLGLAHACGRLLEQLWLVARCRYVGADRELIWRAQPIGDLWASLGISDVFQGKMDEGWSQRQIGDGP